MLKKLWLCFLSAFICVNAYAQIGRTANWYFGKNAGLKFTDTGVSILKDGKINTWEGCSSISDEQGNLLLYSDGKTLWNKYHKVVKNGTGLLGDISSTQSALILPIPKSDSLYVLITSPYAFDFSIGMNYSIINLKGNKDSGIITSKNIKLHNSSSEKIAAINHQNGRDIWVVGHEFGNNRFYAYLLTPEGFHHCPVLSDVGFVFDKNNKFINQGYLKFSNHSNYIVNMQLYNNSSSFCEVFNFNYLTGKLKLINKIPNLNDSYGANFSSNCRFLYITEANKIRQFDLTNFNVSYSFIYNNSWKFSSFQIANNNKIYISQNDSGFLGVINNPDSAGSKCNFNPKGQWLGGKISQFGLPNFNQSYFYTPSINYSYQLNCNSNTIDALAKDTFKASGFKWRCRKQFSSDTFSLVGNAQSLHYNFSDSGTYWLQLIASNNLRSDTSVKSIVIYPAIPQRFLGNDTILAAGSTFSKLLQAPSNTFCNRWLLNDTLIASSDSLPASKFGTYICQSTNPSFCLVTDTIVLIPCIDSLALPVITRSRDSLLVANYFTDSLTWFKNGVLCKTSRQNFIHLNDSGLYSVMLVRKGHCPKISLPYKVTSVCLDTLPVPIISRSRDSLFVSNFIGDTLQWFNNGVLVHTSASNFIHLNTTGTYRVSTIKDFHCTKSSADYTVTSLCIDSLKTPVISRKNDSLFVLNLVADSFVWYKNSSNIQNSASNALALNDTGTYSVVAYKKYLCPRSSDDYKVHQLSTKTVNHSDELIRLFPNPSDGIVYFTCPLPFTLIVTDALGKTVLKQQDVLPVNLPNGIYLFRFILHQQVIIKKVVVL